MKRLISLILITCIMILVITLSGCDFITSLINEFLNNDSESFVLVTFDSMGGSEQDPINVKSGEVAKNLPTPEKPYYDFEGWYTDSACNNPYAEEALDSDITLYAKWKATLYTVNFDTMGGDAIPAVYYSVESSLSSVLSEITPLWSGTANRFLGWFVDSDLTVALDLDTVGYKDLDLFASWELVAPENSININFVLSDGELSFEDAVFEKGAVIDRFPVASKEGHSLDGWYFDEDCTEKYENTSINEDTVLYARWQINFYNFALSNREDVGGTVSGIADGKYAFGAEVSLSFTPAEGYFLLGWYCDGVLLSEDNPYNFTIPAKDMVITVKYSQSSFYKFDKAKDGDLRIESQLSAVPKPYGNGITANDYVHGSTLKIKSSYLNSLPAGDYEFLLRAGNFCDYIQISVYSSDCNPQNLRFDYDRAYPEVKANFTCDCGGEHSISIDGKPAEIFVDQSILSFDKSVSHTLQISCSVGKGTAKITAAAPVCDESYLSKTFKVNGEIYDYYITSIEEMSKAYQYLINSPYSLDFNGYAGGTSIKVAFGGEIKALLDANRTDELLNMAMEDLSYSVSIRTGFSTLSGGNLMELSLFYDNLPAAEFTTGKEKEALADDRIFLTAGNRPNNYNGFAINSFEKTQLISNIFALDDLPYGVMPTFDSSAAGLEAKAVYEKALSICRQYIDDTMSDFRKVEVIYDYLASCITYDDNAVLIAELQADVSICASVSSARNVIVNKACPLSPLYVHLLPVYNLADLSAIKDGLYKYMNGVNFNSLYADELNLLQGQLESATTVSEAKSFVLECIFKTSSVYSIVSLPFEEESVAEMVSAFNVALKKMRAFTLAGSLLDEIAVCDGIASAFKLLCHIEGIECIEVSGFANEAHAWNKVCINGDWYICDATWGRSGNYISHAYLFVSDFDLMKEGRLEQNGEREHCIETLASGSYNYFTQKILAEGIDLVVTDSASLAEIISYYKALGVSTVEFFCDKSYDTVKNYIKNAMGSLHISGSYSISKNEAGNIFILVLPE